MAADGNGDGGRRWWRMTAAADDDGPQDWAADNDGEKQEWPASDSRDSGVVMMATAKMAVAEDSGSG